MNINTPVLVPFPKQIDASDDTVPFPAEGAISVDASVHEHLTARRIDVLIQQLRDELSSVSGSHLHRATHSADASILLTVDEALDDDAYTLSITRNDGYPPVVLTAGGAAGLRDGVQTLRQIIRQYGVLLPQLQIVDEPSMTIRALSYDVSRGRVPTLDTLEALADVMCLAKYNQLQLYVEHTVALPEFRESWIGHDPLTIEELQAFDMYCADRGIELVPEMATFGHMYELMRTRQFWIYGEMPNDADRPFSFVERMLHHTVSPTAPGSLELVTRRIDEYAALFQSRTFNIGADETFDLGHGRSESAAAEVGVPRLYADFVGALCRHLKERNVQPIMYADIALRHPELLDLIDDDVILANWDYVRHPSESNVRTISRQGFRQMVCPGVQTWNRLLPNLDDAWSNISEMCSYGHRYHAVGMIVTDWGDYGHVNDPAMSVPGLLYAAECSWNSTPGDQATVNQRISALTFGDVTGVAVDELVRAGRLQAFSWADLVQYIELDDQGRPNRDVLFVLGQNEKELHTARARFLHERAELISRFSQCNQRLDYCLQCLAPHLHSSRFPARHNALCIDYDLMAMLINGQQLFNSVGAWLLAQYDDGFPAPDITGLADGMEEWYLQFEARWRSIGKEADLARIRDVMQRVTRILRDRKAS